MKNLLVAKILNEIADILEMQNVEFKPRAYRKAARTVESLSKPIEEVYEEHKLKELSGVGESIAAKIGEIIKTGKSKYLEDLKKQMPADIEALTSIEGMGPKSVKMLYEKLKIKTLDDLARAAEQHEIREIKGFGPKTEKNILEHLELAKRGTERILLGFALPIAEEIKERLKKEDSVSQVEVTGSLRRMKETIGDIDILVSSTKPEKTADFFVDMNDVREILGKGATKCSVILKSNIRVDLRIVEAKSFGSALMYFTGSKDHNIKLRKIAMSKSYKLNEYGLFEKDKQITGETEKEVYRKLEMDWIPPELRENRDEIEAAQKHTLPELIGYDAIKGDLQLHTKWTDGENTIEEMAEAAKALGYSYIAITDHYSKMVIAGGLNEQQIRKEMHEIEKINEKIEGIEILKGAEVDIDADGNLQAKESVLKDLDVVVASVHSNFNQTKQKMTERLIKAIESGYVTILGHPTGRKIRTKKSFPIDMDELFEASKRTGTFLEINAFPERLDLDDFHARAAKEAGCKLVIDTDAHNKEHFKYMRLGIAVARRGWVEENDVVNALPLKDLLKLLKN
jgi:DNA polymerase (family 10)